MKFFSSIFLITVVACAGCSKKTDTQTAAASPSAEIAAPAATPAAAAPANAPVANPSKYFADEDAALKAKAYDSAAKALLAAQAQKNLNEQQALEARNRMSGLQRSLAEAIANGDPSARAAAELIRQSTMH